MKLILADEQVKLDKATKDTERNVGGPSGFVRSGAEGRRRGGYHQEQLRGRCGAHCG